MIFIHLLTNLARPCPETSFSDLQKRAMKLISNNWFISGDLGPSDFAGFGSKKYCELREAALNCMHTVCLSVCVRVLYCRV